MPEVRESRNRYPTCRKGFLAPGAARRALLVYLCILTLIAVWGAVAGRSGSIPIWKLQNTTALLLWILKRTGSALGVTLLFIPLGILLVASISPAMIEARVFRRIIYLFCALFLSLSIALLFTAVRSGFSPAHAVVIGMIMPCLGCLIGLWLGMSLLRRENAIRWLLGKTAVLLLIVISLCAVIVWRGLEGSPLPFHPARYSSEDKRQLVELLRGKDPREIAPDGAVSVTLTEDAANKLLAWGLSIGSKGRKARLLFERDIVGLFVSLELPVSYGRLRYLNVHGEAMVHYDTDLRIRPLWLAVGEMSVPRCILQPLSSVLLHVFFNDPHINPLYRAIHHCQVIPGELSIRYGRVNLSDTYAADVAARIGLSGEIAQATREQITGLIRLALRNEKEPLSLEDCFKASFGIAEKRSINGDPVTENSGAILALGILLGHERIQAFIAGMPKDRIPFKARRRLAAVAIRGRRDWARHFTVSAALEVLSNVMTSDAIGLLKEELDARPRGSGFSFADLLADRAGATFASVATRDKSSALMMQLKINYNFRIEDFFPPTDDLPENISARELESVYGGVGGIQYNQLIKKIDTRIALCRAYQY
ncbi:MAG: hypothetical protein ACMUIL_03795 [bacterium]